MTDFSVTATIREVAESMDLSDPGEIAAEVANRVPEEALRSVLATDQRRAHTATSHPEWTDGHSHNDGLRVASKAILRDLWRAARDWHAAKHDD